MYKNILVVDNDYNSQKLLKGVLAESNYNVFVANCCKESANILDKNQIDLIILELSLDKKNNFEFCKKLKGKKDLNSIPFIYISENFLEEDISNAIEFGSSDFIIKPINYKVLMAKIKSILKLKGEKDKLRQIREEQINLIEETSKQKELLSQEAEFTKELNRFLDAETKKNFIRDELARFLDVKLFTIFIIDEEKREFKLFVTNHPNLPPKLVIPIDKESVMCDVLRNKNILYYNNFMKTNYKKSGRKKYKTNTVGVVPLISGERIIGVLNVNDPGLANINGMEFEGRIERLSKHLAVSIHNTILYEKVKDLSKRDSMTGLYNFRHFIETLKIEVEEALKYKEPLSCIMLDIDNFKKINDTYGHQIGDFTLKELARSVTMSVRSSDIPARYGGDEFIIVLPKTDKRYALRLSQRLMKIFSENEIKIPETKKVVKVTLSIGISSLPDDTTDMNDLITKSDKALYQAKKEGKNRIVEYIK